MASVFLQPWGAIMVLVLTPDRGPPVQAVISPSDALVLARDLLEWEPVRRICRDAAGVPAPLASSRWALLEFDPPEEPCAVSTEPDRSSSGTVDSAPKRRSPRIPRTPGENGSR